MTLQEILAHITDEGAKEGLVSLLKAETDKGTSHQTESASLRDAFKELGYDKDKFSDITDFVNQRNTSSKESAEKNTVTISSLNDKLNDLTLALESEKAGAEKIRADGVRSQLTAELTSKIGNEFYGSNYMIKDLVENNGVGFDGNNNIEFVNGDEKLSFDKGFEQLKINNKDMLKVSQSGGTESTGGDNSQGDSEYSTLEQLMLND